MIVWCEAITVWLVQPAGSRSVLEPIKRIHVSGLWGTGKPAPLVPGSHDGQRNCFQAGSIPNRSCKDPSMVTSKDVFLAARAGDVLATMICNEFADLLGSGIANIVSLVNPEIVILGGSVGSNAGFLIPRMLEVVNTWAQPVSAQSVHILQSTLAGDAGLLGAAYGVLLKLENKNM